MKWNPIETAPDDGTDILLFSAERHARNEPPVVGAQMTSGAAGWGAGWYGFENIDKPLDIKPTHWLPLPTPPGKHAVVSKKVISVAEAGARIGIGRAAAYLAAKHGQIPTMRVGRKLLVSIEAFDKMMARGVTNSHDGEGHASPTRLRNPGRPERDFE